MVNSKDLHTMENFVNSATGNMEQNGQEQSLQKKEVLKCWSCKDKVAKYKCPKCSIRTCSVECVKHHKKLNECDGIRCKTEYVAKENFTETNLLSDYKFLEEVNRCACTNDRNVLPYPKSKNV
uniref:Box C/D snoRNA protein 1 n=1 Tax=Ciona intestinalis TaxID=7719 RepID=F6RIF9_CIOIN